MTASTASQPKLRVNAVSETIRERTLEALREAICNMHFKPGQRLVERELCEQTGVSRTTVREALRHLETEGLVEMIPRKGPVVASLTAADARKVYQVRGALERLAGRLFAEKATPRDIAHLSNALKRLRTATAEHDLKSALAANENFYDIIFSRCGNDYAHALYKLLKARIMLLRARITVQWSRENNRASLARMKGIVEAIKQKDAAAVQALLEDHAARSAETILAMLENSGAQLLQHRPPS